MPCNNTLFYRRRTAVAPHRRPSILNPSYRRHRRNGKSDAALLFSPDLDRVGIHFTQISAQTRATIALNARGVCPSRIAQRFCVIISVCPHIFARQATNWRLGRCAVTCLARRQDAPQQIAEAVHSHVDRCRPPLARPIARASAPLFARRTLMHAEDGGVDHQVFEVRIIGHGDKQPLPDTIAKSAKTRCSSS